MNKYTKLLKNTSILGMGAFLSKVLVFLLLPLYSSVMTTSDYGTADIVAQSANLLQPLITLGICNAVFRFCYDDKDNQDAVFTIGFSTLIAGMGIFALCIPLLKKIYILDDYMLLLALYVFMYGMHTICAQFLRGRGLVKTYAVKGVLCTVFTLVFNILLLVVFRLGVTGYLVANILADFFTVLYMFKAADLVDAIQIKKYSPRLAVNMLKYSIPLIPTTVFWWITNISDRYVILYMVDEAASGVYAMGYKIPNIVIMLTGVFIEAWQMSLVEEDNKGSMGKFFTKVFEGYKSVMFIAASGLILFVKVITKILIKNDFYEAWQYTPFLIVATVCSGLVTFVSVIFLVKKKSVNSLICSSASAIINILLNIILIKAYGVMGAAVATMISYIAVYFLASYRSQLYVKYKPYHARTAVNIALVILQSIAMVYFGKASYVISAILFVVIVLFNFQMVMYTVKTFLGKRNEKKNAD